MDSPRFTLDSPISPSESRGKGLNIGIAIGVVLSGFFYFQFLPQALGWTYIPDSDTAKRIVLALSIPIEIALLFVARYIIPRFSPRHTAIVLLSLVVIELLSNVALTLLLSGVAFI